jgi:threonyl-tRNA synthetase
MSQSSLEALRHTAAHVLAYAVQELFPEAKPTIGPSIENGFYYDFDRPTPFTPEDLAALEARMKTIVQADYEMTGERVTREPKATPSPSTPSASSPICVAAVTPTGRDRSAR